MKGVLERESMKGKISFLPGLFKYRLSPDGVNAASYNVKCGEEKLKLRAKTFTVHLQLPSIDLNLKEYVIHPFFEFL